MRDYCELQAAVGIECWRARWNGPPQWCDYCQARFKGAYQFGIAVERLYSNEEAATILLGPKESE